ncbi:hypothetical protein CPS_4300 [Colwellia psychrerythraea 34H]|uniref:Uncharacterized protein n=1 Tax=Colwellia psychrerythraea (strain 34H / ATCC BAA-681) TaxID=167879 RepID=Q47W72_COLP3|nr:hypothetical protein CPS_4300 [Colwellia psychrerythraea 34H]
MKGFLASSEFLSLLAVNMSAQNYHVERSYLVIILKSYLYFC